ncbi:hypothetical protein BDD12DRAFT_243103 [Trichophaea hybrida]|nr:hypothetical protein BDD12DRAFT_243103 [Trichophaea hybrida]
MCAESHRPSTNLQSHLLTRHKTLMHRKKNQYILSEEPVIVDIAGEEIQLEPKSRVVPIPVKTFTTCLDLMKTPQDLDAIPGLVQGFHKANRNIRERQFEKMTRLINMSGRIDLLMRLARNAGNDSGFKFTQNVAREFMRGIRIQSLLPAKEEALKALRNSETLLNILGEPQMKMDPDARLKRDPVVVGTVLSMFANTSVRFNDGSDYKGYTFHYLQRLQKCWDAVEWEQNLKDGDRKSVWRVSHAVLNYIPVLEGLVKARDILTGTKVTPWVEAESAKLNNAIGEWRRFLDENAPGKKPYGAHSYKEVAERLAKELNVEEEADGLAEESSAEETPAKDANVV